MFHYHTKFAMVLTVFMSCSTRAKANPNCERTCGEHSLKYPFGFSSDCEVKLNCNNSVVKIGELEVQNVTSDSIFVTLPAKCNRSVSSIRPLFGNNYAPTWNNSFLVQSCKTGLGGCVIPTASFVGRNNLVEGCDDKSGNVSCFTQSQRNRSREDVLTLGDWDLTGCKFLFSAVALDESKGKGLSVQFQMVELGWWLQGSCRCSNNASCVKVQLAGGKRGFRCRCQEGFVGDGFVDGDGCRRVSQCNASTFWSGGCRKVIKIGVIVGGIIVGAILVVTLSLICYFARRRSSWLRKQVTVKRLLREAAGNSPVPLYPYKEIERATSFFSDKHRLGTGAFGTVYAGHLHSNDLVAIKKIKIRRDCVDEIIDPFLDPHRDAWTLYSLHKVAELAFRCLAFHSDMRPTMIEVAEELEHIRRSGWATMEETICTASSVGSACSSPRNGSENSLRGVSFERAAGHGSERLIVPHKTDVFLQSIEEVTDGSPVSVYDTWLSGTSSPSTNSLLGNVVQ
ncbi:Wall-associated receptor kinase 14 [Spatholobus suberectus]|nr:Wall-associated receptor kinase 14 [Spatholobus suberectus]